MSEHSIIAGGITEALERRHLHQIEAGGVIGLVAAMPDRCPGIGKEQIRMGNAFHRIDHGGGIDVEVLR